MQCPNCKLINPPTAQRCDCGYDFDAKKLKSPLVQERADPLSKGAVLFALATAVFAYLAEFTESYRDYWGAAGGALGHWSIATFIILAYLKLKKGTRSRSRKLTLISIAALIIASLSFDPPLSKSDFPRLLREAAGTAPIQGDQDDLVASTFREMFREEISFVSDYQKDTARFETDEMKMLLEPISFASRENIHETLEQLRDMQLTGEKYLSRFKAIGSKLSKSLGSYVQKLCMGAV